MVLYHIRNNCFPIHNYVNRPNNLKEILYKYIVKHIIIYINRISFLKYTKRPIYSFYQIILLPLMVVQVTKEQYWGNTLHRIRLMILQFNILRNLTLNSHTYSLKLSNATVCIQRNLFVILQTNNGIKPCSIFKGELHFLSLNK